MTTLPPPRPLGSTSRFPPLDAGLANFSEPAKRGRPRKVTASLPSPPDKHSVTIIPKPTPVKRPAPEDAPKESGSAEAPSSPRKLLCRGAPPPPVAAESPPPPVIYVFVKDTNMSLPCMCVLNVYYIWLSYMTYYLTRSIQVMLGRPSPSAIIYPHFEKAGVLIWRLDLLRDPQTQLRQCLVPDDIHMVLTPEQRVVVTQAQLKQVTPESVTCTGSSPEALILLAQRYFETRAEAKPKAN